MECVSNPGDATSISACAHLQPSHELPVQVLLVNSSEDMARRWSRELLSGKGIQVRCTAQSRREGIERQQQERLAKQPFMLWFKDPQGRLVSANASVLQDWQHFAQDAALEKVDLASMPMSFSHSSASAFSVGVGKSS